MTVTSEVVALCIAIVSLKPEDKPVRAPPSPRLYIGHFVNCDSCRDPHCCQSYNNPGPGPESLSQPVSCAFYKALPVQPALSGERR